jgi:hypothetical protein
MPVGVSLIIAIWAAMRGGWWRKPTNDALPEADATPSPVEPVHDYPEGLAEAHGPVPLIVKIIIVSFVVWTVIYVYLFVQAGFNFG